MQIKYLSSSSNLKEWNVDAFKQIWYFYIINYIISIKFHVDMKLILDRPPVSI